MPMLMLSLENGGFQKWRCFINTNLTKLFISYPNSICDKKSVLSIFIGVPSSWFAHFRSVPTKQFKPATQLGAMKQPFLGVQYSIVSNVP